jgi:hypothetical protein
MSHSSREFHLVVDQLSQPFVDDAKISVLGDQAPRLVVPDGVTYLLAPSGKPPLLLGDAESGNAEHAFLLEPVFSQKQPYLVLIGQAGKDVRVNGQVAPCLAALREKDQIQFGDELMLHVTLFSRPCIASVPDELIDKECPLCRLPFVTGIRVFVCANCTTAMHLQGEEEPEATRLECALAATECPVCQTPIEMTEGYRYEPELYSVV